MNNAMEPVWEKAAAVGTTHGDLTIIGGTRALKRCRCICGAVVEVRRALLLNGNTGSCGCGRARAARERFRTHGEVKHVNGRRTTTPEYRAWQALRNRCLNKNGNDYKYYGGRGVTLAHRWNKYENFLADMGRRPSPVHTLERKNVHKGYSKGNCEWATRKAQARNRTYCVLTMKKAEQIRALYKTKKYFQHEIAAQFGITQAHVSQIIRKKAWAP